MQLDVGWSDPVGLGDEGGGEEGGHAVWAGLHTFRHSIASIMFRRGVPKEAIRRLLGHHSPAFTLAVYVHLLPDDLPQPTFFDEVAKPPQAGRETKHAAA